MSVQGILVEKPNADLAKWIKAIIFVHTAFCLFTSYIYYKQQVSEMRWYGLLVSWVLFGLIVPAVGCRASQKTEKKRLSVFSGIQGFLGFCNLINFLSFSSILTTVINWCFSDNCLAQFDTKNHSCAVNFGNQTYEMDESYCQDIPQNIGTALFFALLSFTSCMGAIHARKMKQIEIVDVVMVEHQRVGMPQIPEEIGRVQVE